MNSVSVLVPSVSNPAKPIFRVSAAGLFVFMPVVIAMGIGISALLLISNPTDSPNAGAVGVLVLLFSLVGVVMVIQSYRTSTSRGVVRRAIFFDQYFEVSKGKVRRRIEYEQVASISFVNLPFPNAGYLRRLLYISLKGEGTPLVIPSAPSPKLNARLREWLPSKLKEKPVNRDLTPPTNNR